MKNKILDEFICNNYHNVDSPIKDMDCKTTQLVKSLILDSNLKNRIRELCESILENKRSPQYSCSYSGYLENYNVCTESINDFFFNAHINGGYRMSIIERFNHLSEAYLTKNKILKVRNIKELREKNLREELKELQEEFENLQSINKIKSNKEVSNELIEAIVNTLDEVVDVQANQAGLLSDAYVLYNYINGSEVFKSLSVRQYIEEYKNREKILIYEIIDENDCALLKTSCCYKDNGNELIYDVFSYVLKSIINNYRGRIPKQHIYKMVDTLIFLCLLVKTLELEFGLILMFCKELSNGHNDVFKNLIKMNVNEMIKFCCNIYNQHNNQEVVFEIALIYVSKLQNISLQDLNDKNSFKEYRNIVKKAGLEPVKKLLKDFLK